METHKPTLVVILSRFPYPLEKGDKLRAYHQIKFLANHYSIILICTIENKIAPKHYNEIKQYCTEIHLFKLSKLGLLVNVLLVLFSSLPFQATYFYRFTHARKINRLLLQIQPDHIYCQLVRMTEYVKSYHFCPKTLDYMDALSVGMERRIKNEKWYKKWFFRMESKRLGRYERSVFDYFEHKVIISKQDLTYILHPKNQQIKVIPNGVDASFFENLNLEKKYDLLFTGNFSYPPNIRAAHFLAEELLPELNKKGYALTLLLAGANPTESVQQLASSSITVSGWIDDIRESYGQSRIFIAPLFLGTGLQNKLLEAMAVGLPCITTRLANNALGGTDNQNIVLAENKAEFVEKVIQFLTNKDTFTSIHTNGQRFVKNGYAWDTQNKLLLSVIQDSKVH